VTKEAFVSYNTFATTMYFAALAGTLGCSMQAASGPGQLDGPAGTSGRLRFAVSSRAARPLEAAAAFRGAPSRCTPTLSAAANATAITCGGDVLVLRKVSVVLREIELERAGVVTCDQVVGNDDCEEVETGPVRFDLPLGVTTVAHVVTVDGMPPGTYDELEFEIHRPSVTGNPAFVMSNPDLAGISVRVEGTFTRGDAPAANFVYTSDLEVEQEEDVALTVPQSGSVGVTLGLDISRWFFVDGGLVDPRTANDEGSNESEVRHNIRDSVKAFRDDDQDGVKDDEGLSVRT
jgi:hypothetical protein